MLCGRAEDFGRDEKLREIFDVVTARAVGSLPEVCELALPFARVGGHLVLWRGQNAAAELAQAKSALFQLGGASTRAAIFYQLPNHDTLYHLVAIDKRRATPRAFPRRNGLPKKEPLT